MQIDVNRCRSAGVISKKSIAYDESPLRALRRNLKAEKAYEEERAKHVPVDKEQQARRDAAIEFAIAEAEAQKRAFIDKLRASGDFRQMRIHEEDFFRIRERVTKFYSG